MSEKDIIKIANPDIYTDDYLRFYTLNTKNEVEAHDQAGFFNGLYYSTYRGDLYNSQEVFTFKKLDGFSDFHDLDTIYYCDIANTIYVDGLAEAPVASNKRYDLVDGNYELESEYGIKYANKKTNLIKTNLIYSPQKNNYILYKTNLNYPLVDPELWKTEGILFIKTEWLRVSEGKLYIDYNGVIYDNIVSLKDLSEEDHNIVLQKLQEVESTGNAVTGFYRYVDVDELNVKKQYYNLNETVIEEIYNIIYNIERKIDQICFDLHYISVNQTSSFDDDGFDIIRTFKESGKRLLFVSSESSEDENIYHSVRLNSEKSSVTNTKLLDPISRIYSSLTMYDERSLGYEHRIDIKSKIKEHIYNEDFIIAEEDEYKVIDNNYIDSIIIKGKWRTPFEYYNSDVKSDDFSEFRDVYDTDVEKKAIAFKPNWFWVETLKNWCYFELNNNDVFTLMMWNGWDNWESLYEIMKSLYDPEDTRDIRVKYDEIRQRLYFDMKFVTNAVGGGLRTQYVTQDHRDFFYYAIKLHLDEKFSNYDFDSFQSIRKNKIIRQSQKSNNHRYVYLLQGCPFIFKNASGELILITYIKLPGSGSSNKKPQSVISLEDMQYINTVARTYFGNGSDKTIADHWKRPLDKREGNVKASEFINKSASAIVDVSEITTFIDKREIPKMKFVLPRPLTKTKEAFKESVVKRWEG